MTESGPPIASASLLAALGSNPTTCFEAQAVESLSREERQRMGQDINQGPTQLSCVPAIVRSATSDLSSHGSEEF